MSKLITVINLAELLNIKTNTVYAWVYRKKIPYVKIGGKLLFDEDEIKNFIESNKVAVSYSK